MNTNPFIARWSRSGNLLCHGEWQITYSGTPLTLPEPLRDKDMGTYGIYDIMDPDNELFADGLKEDDWILANLEWLADVFVDHEIPIEESLVRDFYQAVNRTDWRCTSCAGCM
ncbi:Uncharacterised protein [Leminorella richardii]|uniref:Uncharacterized protein n=1 Tax=Leminorella richardii TaxID=158841 RepID=A0A2X4XK25_9GAMM|nr:hypothetical protein [Leminorella richardii]SQI36984.1 Uncharacterised protein [Leminorella richardii]